MYRAISFTSRSRAFDEEVGVIAHQAVRKNQEVLVRGGTQELRDRFPCRNRVSEHGLSRSRTKCQEIAVKSDVLEAVETTWARHKEGDRRNENAGD